MSERKHRDEEVLRELYVRRGMSSREVADELGCSKSTVLEWLNRHDIPTETSTRDKPPNFRTNQLGYEEVRTRAGGERHQVYVHRLMAAAEFGLDAIRDVDVHHKNDIPWDNRRANLAVMPRSEHVRKHHEEGHYDRHLEELHEEQAWTDAEVGDV